MEKPHRVDYDVSLHAVERYVERVEGRRASSMHQRQIDAIRWNIRRDLEHAQALPPAAELALMRRGMFEPNVKALVADTRVYLLKGRKVLTMFEVDPDALALADELAEQSEESSGIFRSSEACCPEALTCPSQNDAVRGLSSLTISRHVLGVLTGAWDCTPGHHDFASRLVRLRRCAQRINPRLFRQDADVEPDAAWTCFRHEYLRFAVAGETMVACIVI